MVLDSRLCLLNQAEKCKVGEGGYEPGCYELDLSSEIGSDNIAIGRLSRACMYPPIMAVGQC